jgi:competence protein ComEA
MVFLGCAIIVGSTVLYWVYIMEPEVITGEDIESSESLAPVQEEEGVLRTAIEEPELMVSVQGAVQDPEVYRFAVGACVDDALELAGGVEPLVDTTSINLAVPLVDGSTLFIPLSKKVDTETLLLKNHSSYLLGMITQSEVEKSGVSESSKVNINTATQAELETLTGVGPTYAQAIIASRTQ